MQPNLLKVIVFTGAGISEESGLETFRRGGMWDGMDARLVANIEAWHQGDASRQRMLDFYNQRRRDCRAAQPNAAHYALAELETQGHYVTVITQNIDDLHERAGSTRVIHLHGEILKVHPDEHSESPIAWLDDLNLGDRHEGVQLRPHVVWFGEGVPNFVPAYEIATAPSVDVLIVVGTTLEVGPANLIAFQTQADRVYLVDPHPPDHAPLRRLKTRRIAMPATQGVPLVVAELSGE